MTSNRYPLFLSFIFILLSLWSGYEPASRDVWIAEVIPVFAIFFALVVTYTKFQFSHLAYTLMSFWLYMHTIGAHYTFAEVPFDFVNNLIGSERNMFDRVAHYIIGFYAYPMAEWLMRKNLCAKPLAMFFSLFFIMSVAASYEIIEWIYAVVEGGDAGIEFLGSQGDIWDAQKDMLADTLGAITSLIIFMFTNQNLRSD